MTPTPLSDFLASVTRRPVERTVFGPPAAEFAMCRVDDWPAGCSTWVTDGLWNRPFSLWRGLPLGRELVLSLATGTDADQRDMVLETVQAAVLEDDRRLRDRDRRPAIEANGASAPGYPPYLVFIETVLPAKLRKRSKLGDSYVTFLAAVPIGERELRAYDAGPGAFVETLAPGDAVRFPR